MSKTGSILNFKYSRSGERLLPLIDLRRWDLCKRVRTVFMCIIVAVTMLGCESAEPYFPLTSRTVDAAQNDGNVSPSVLFYSLVPITAPLDFVYSFVRLTTGFWLEIETFGLLFERPSPADLWTIALDAPQKGIVFPPGDIHAGARTYGNAKCQRSKVPRIQ